jgi:succinyl-CoA synthetase beta subunit
MANYTNPLIHFFRVDRSLLRKYNEPSMKIHEYQAKEIFRRYGIPVPKERLARTPEEAVRASEEVGLPVVVKAQVLVGGRGKAGGIRKADSRDEVKAAASQLLKMELKGVKVESLLVSQAVEIEKEVFLSITVDRRNREPVMIASEAGGVEIEVVAAQHPEAIHKASIDPLLGLLPYQARELGFGVLPERVDEFSKIAQALARMFFELDSSLVEINPLVKIRDGGLLALDAKIVFDDSGIIRHPELEALRRVGPDETRELEAQRLGLSYIKLSGDIGCVVNGAGLAMATMDLVKRYGGEPANFLDIGGSSSPEKMRNAMRILLSDPDVRAVFVNIFGGITRCDDVAQGLLQATRELKLKLPMVVRLTGTNEDRAMELLKGSNITPVKEMAEGVKKAIEMVKGEERKEN